MDDFFIFFSLLVILSLGRCSRFGTDTDSGCPSFDGWHCYCVTANDSIVAAECSAEKGSLKRILNYLPSTMLNLTFKVDILDEKGAKFTHLHRLQKLEIAWIRDPIELAHAGRTHNFDSNAEGLFEGLDALRILTISIPTNHVYPRLLRPLEKLQVLDFSYMGYLNTSGLADVFNGSLLNEKPLTTILLKRLAGVDPNKPRQFNLKDLLPLFKGLNITELDISENGEVYLYPGIIEYTPYLHKLRGADINIRFDQDQPEQANCMIVEGLLHQHMVLLDISNIDMIGFEIFDRSFVMEYVTTWLACWFERSCICETHRKICGRFIGDNFTCENFPGVINPRDFIDLSCEFGLKIPVPTRIKKLYSRNTQYNWSYGKWQARNVCFGTNEIKKFDFSFVKFPLSSSGVMSLTGLDLLEEFAVEYSDWGQAFVNPKFLHTLPRMRKLQLCGTTTGLYIANDTNTEIFKTSARLSELYLCNARISFIPPEEFSFLTELTHLDLSGNDIKDISVDLDNLTSLAHFNVSNNKLHNLTIGIITVLTANQRNRDVVVDLSGNILSCNCDSWQFLKWVNQTKVLLVNKSQYLCLHPNGLRRLASVEEELDTLEKYCFPPPDYSLYIYISAASFCSITLSFLLVLMYRLRWKIRFLCLWLRHRHELYGEEQLYTYDAFVVYSDEDRYWVHQMLLQKLEKERNLRLCVHFRDFVPGHNIEEQIVSNINASRKTIVVVSPHFLESNWCDFEMQIARNRLYTDGINVIVPVILIECPKESLTPTMKNILASTTYITWKNDQSYEEYFWESITFAICRKVDSVTGIRRRLTNSEVDDSPNAEIS